MKYEVLYLKAVHGSKGNKREVKDRKNLKGIKNTGERSQLSHNSYPIEVLFALRWQVKEKLERLVELRDWAVDYFSQYDK